MFWEYWHIYWICGLDLAARLLPGPLHLAKILVSEWSENGTIPDSETWKVETWAPTVFHVSQFLNPLLIIFFASRQNRKRLIFCVAITLLVLLPLEFYFMTLNQAFKSFKTNIDIQAFDIDTFVSNYTTILTHMLVYYWMLHWLLTYLKEAKFLLFTTNGKICGIKFKDFFYLLVPRIASAFYSGVKLLLKAWEAYSKMESAKQGFIMVWVIHAAVNFINTFGTLYLILGSRWHKLSWTKIGYVIHIFSTSIGTGLGLAVLDPTLEINKKTFRNFMIVLIVVLLFVYFMTLVILLRIWELTANRKENCFWRDAKIYGNRHFQIDKSHKLGSGFFGEVFKGEVTERIWTFGKEFGKIERKTVAVKFFPSTMTNNPFHEIRNELKTLIQRIPEEGHENVVKLVGLYLCEKDVSKIGIMLEYCENGALLQKLLQIKENPFVPESVIMLLFDWAQQILEGMKYLASLHIIHGDLAARNVLLDNNLSCKITDFGMSKKLYEYQAYVSGESAIFPWRWGAPESLSTLNVSLKTDVWAFGVLLWEIFSLGDVPYFERDWASDFVLFLQNGNRLEKPFHMPAEMYHNIVLKCWEWDPAIRPSFIELKGLLKLIRQFMY